MDAMKETVIVEIPLATAFRDELQNEATQRGMTLSELLCWKLSAVSMPSGDAVRVTTGTVAGRRTMRIEFPLPGEVVALVRQTEARQATRKRKTTAKGKR